MLLALFSLVSVAASGDEVQGRSVLSVAAQAGATSLLRKLLDAKASVVCDGEVDFLSFDLFSLIVCPRWALPMSQLS